MSLVLLRLRYDGTELSGVSRVAGRRTVLGELDAALAAVGATARLDAVARTDAGVHADDAVVVVRDLTRLTPMRLAGVLARRLPGDVAVWGWAEVDAVPDVADKTYRYTLDLSAAGLPLRRREAWRPPSGVDEAGLRAALAELVGERDFAAWARRGETRSVLVRRIDATSFTRVGDLGELRLRGPAFTYRLVRSLVGAVVALASGGLSPQAWRDALGGMASAASVHQAPARGLALEAIRWSEPIAWRDPVARAVDVGPGDGVQGAGDASGRPDHGATTGSS